MGRANAAEPSGTDTGVSGYVPLPQGLTDPATQARAVFDQAASIYDRGRPGYPSVAVNDLKQLCGIAEGASVLEVGCGTGQLTRDLAPTGARIRCVEAGSSLAALARANLARHPNVHVSTIEFERFEGRAETYDAVVSATAFHWIDPNVSFANAARLMRPGGHLALLTNIHSAGGTHTKLEFAEAVRDLHRRLAPEIGEWTFPDADEIVRRANEGGDIAAVWARVERKLWDPPPVSHLFEPPIIGTYPWIASYDTDTYLAMLSSQSSYGLLDQRRRRDLLAGIGRHIDRNLSGVITKEYVTVLAVGRHRGEQEEE